MATNAPIEQTQTGDNQGWSPEELNAFGVTAEIPKEEKKEEVKPAGLSNSEMAQLQLQATQELSRQTALIQQQLNNQRPTETKASGPQLPGTLPVKFDKDGNPYVDTKDVMSASRAVVDQYHKDVIEPVAPVVDTARQQQQLSQTINWLKSEDPTVLADKDASHVAALAVGLYHSELNPGRNDLEKSNYVLNQLREMKANPGNPTIKGTQPSNQVGRTATDAPGRDTILEKYPPGSKITIHRTTIAEMGRDAFEASVDQERYLRDRNAREKNNWTIDIKRP